MWGGVVTGMLIFIGTLIMVSAGIAALIFIIYFLAHAKMIFSFKGEYKETEATLMYFMARGLGTADKPKSYTPVLKYFNEYNGEWKQKEFFNIGIQSPVDVRLTKREKFRIAKPGEKIKIQYTKNSERVVDKRYCSDNKYRLKRFLIPIIVCVSLSIFGLFMILAGILMDIDWSVF